MTGRTRTQLGLLGALVAAFVVVMFVVSRGESPTAPVPARSNRSGARAPAASQTPPVVDVRIEQLKVEHDPAEAPRRNPFVFAPKPPPPSPSRLVDPGDRPEVTPPSPSGPPPPAPIPLKFIGVLDTAGVRVAILSDARGNVFYGREGATIDGRYKLMKIGNESAELSYVDGRGRQTLRLSGQ